jgi:nicotinate-nucleotide pyrophosphorylase (carboxylating)
MASLTQAVKLAGDSVETEVSGNVSLENVSDIARYGINFVSIGALTKNVQAIDLSLLFTS